MITADKAKAHLNFIASDLLEGRDTPSRGLDIAAAYIAANLAQWGVKPAGDNGTYFQRFPVYENKVVAAESYCEINGVRFDYGECIVYPLSGQGKITADVVYVQHGWRVPKKGIDPYKGLDVKGKIIIVHRDYPPKGIDPADLGGKDGTDFSSPWKAAHELGAVGIIYIPSFFRFSTWRDNERHSIESGYALLERDPMLAMSASHKLIGALFAGEGKKGESVITGAWQGKFVDAFALKKKLTMSVTYNTGMGMAQNVVGIVEGTDKKNEYVAMGAHYDHIGIGDAVNGDKINNGADDDGSGTVGLLTLAETYAKGARPKRSLLFVWHAGEEKGPCLGSVYFTSHPTVPINQVVTQLNIDMIGRSKAAGDSSEGNADLSGPNEIYVIGSKAMSSELGRVSERTNQSFLKLQFNYKYDDVNDPERYFTRSDHYNYAQKGVPIIFYFDGGHVDYHEPSDSVEKIDFGKIVKVARTVYATGFEIANSASRPKVDLQLPDAWKQ